MGQQLEKLLQQCTVKITISGHRGWGTGFLVAPEQILTCFHVIKNAENRPITITWPTQEQTAKATVERSHESLDIALLKFQVTIADLPCVYLDEAFQAEDRFYIYGYPDDFPQGASVTGQCEGIAQDEQRLIKFKAAQVRPGLSGSPILNQRTRKVCGMVKFTRDRSIDLGGGAILVKDILSVFPDLIDQQRTFHQHNRQWRSLLSRSSDNSHLSRQAYRNRHTLLNKVHHYWIEGVLEKSLDYHAAIELGLEERSDAVISPANLVVEFSETSQVPLTPGTAMIDIFDELGTGRTLLILGAPGSGKTISMLQLAQTLIQRALEDFKHLIPVVFNLSSWVEQKQSIETWLIKELYAKYQVPETVGRDWVKREQLLLLLDGLDEILNKDCREACVNALNQFHQDFGSPEMVVCCRETDYLVLSERLNFERAIYLRKLTLEQVDRYLESAGAALAPLRSLMQHDAVLQELAKSPLMLHVMAIAYQGVEVDELPKTDLIEEQRRHLFDAYIQRMFQRRRQNIGQYSQEQTIAWLTWLARRMCQFSQTMLLIETMQPTWLDTQQAQFCYQVGVRFLVFALWSTVHLGLLGFHHSLLERIPYPITPLEGLNYGMIGGLIGAIIYGLIGGLTDKFINQFNRLTNGLLLTLIYGLIFGIIWQKISMGIAYGLMYGLVGIIIYRPMSQYIDPVETFQWSWKRLGLYLGLGLIITFAIFLAGTAGGIIQSFIFGMMVCLIFMFTKGEDIEEKTVVNQGIWRSAANASKVFLTIGVLTMVMLTVVEDLISGLVNGLILGLLGALLGAQFSGIVCIQHFVLRFILWTKGNISWNYARFLNYAADRVFLRKVGGGYIFIHRQLRNHFAQISKESPDFSI